MNPILQVPTHIISGFLGVGKTTAVIDLLRQKPGDEKWAVLVNEFGKMGIDQHIYRAQNIEVAEIPCGCMCCAQGVALQVAINQLLRQARPDRLIIESSGVGHPAGVLKTLKGEGFKDSLKLKASICLIDPRHLLIDKYRTNELFRQQIEYADVLLANKADIASAEALQAFAALVQTFQPPKQLTATIQHGHISTDLLELEHRPATTRFSLHAPACETPASGFQTHSLQADASTVFDFECLQQWLDQLDITRAKGLLKTNSGMALINLTDGQLDMSLLNNNGDLDQPNQIEFIAPVLDVHALAHELNQCVR